jgi:hypothetical protein
VKTELLARSGACLAGAWAGVMLGIGTVAAPVLFASLPRADAGRIAARLFAHDATLGVVAGAVLALVGLQVGRERAEQGRGSRFGAELALPLAALFCVVAGYYGLQPTMEEARTGSGALSFAALHAIATAFFAVKLAVVVVLAWRLAGWRR